MEKAFIDKFVQDKRDLRTKTKWFVSMLFEGKKDKAGIDYIEHLLFVESQVETETEKIVALLHDTVEDTFITLEDLKKMGYSSEVVEAVSLLTKRNDMSYANYIDHLIASNNEIALRVKQADLRHNMDLSRLPVVTEEDKRRVETKYIPSMTKIENHFRKKAYYVRH